MSLVLCDDHTMFLDALAGALTGLHHDVAAACLDPGPLVDVVREMHPDGCVLDVRFGGRSRLDAAFDVHEAAPDTAVVLLTGAVTAAEWDAYDRGVVNGMISKALDVDDLDRCLQRILAGERLVAGFSRPAPTPTPAEMLEPLTERETEVLRLIVEGVSTQSMATRLEVSANTVRTHVQNVLRKLRVHHRSMAACRAVELGLVEVGP
jgi:DNA-binding NarL/FixJ family response regulator